ncbi:MAG: molybdenum cofactor biosynthesis protein [Planctomycetota bacterium]|nr:MAG: molybdenum cofactor biosynthesis protein [Planctomycetota bacterium]
MSTIPETHRAAAPASVACAVVTVSDTRTLENDTGGGTVVSLLEAAGHRVMGREIVRDEPDLIRNVISRYSGRSDVDAILLTGGTGLSSRDQTFETVTSLFTKRIDGYGELFRLLSFQEIGAAAMLSRAVGGLIGAKIVLTMPGSPAAVRLAMEKLILPELGHLRREATR